ncbi:hypothetical protein ACFFQG_29975 [Shinella granuli]|uniref:hypothetical protein n=1 Tax=Shinella granuli TaxID=323621 RepID=UPI0035F03EB8
MSRVISSFDDPAASTSTMLMEPWPAARTLMPSKKLPLLTIEKAARNISGVFLFMRKDRAGRLDLAQVARLERF